MRYIRAAASRNIAVNANCIAAATAISHGSTPPAPTRAVMANADVKGAYEAIIANGSLGCDAAHIPASADPPTGSASGAASIETSSGRDTSAAEPAYMDANWRYASGARMRNVAIVAIVASIGGNAAAAVFASWAPVESSAMSAREV